ncbi:hypothetical protein HDU96_003905, partial [Phlyctochytrium bullatum]
MSVKFHPKNLILLLLLAILGVIALAGTVRADDCTTCVNSCCDTSCVADCNNDWGGGLCRRCYT